MVNEQHFSKVHQQPDESNNASDDSDDRRASEPLQSVSKTDDEAAMTESRQPEPEQIAQAQQHDEREQHHGEHRHAEHNRDDASANAARRASLKKEIRAGWRRALGH